mgnify:CR=1 FL=1
MQGRLQDLKALLVKDGRAILINDQWSSIINKIINTVLLIIAEEGLIHSLVDIMVIYCSKKSVAGNKGTCKCSFHYIFPAHP